MKEYEADNMQRPTTLRIDELKRLGYTWQDLCFGKYFKAVNKIGITVLECTFKLIYQSLDTDSGRLSIRNYCLKKLKWKSTYYNKIFFANEREILDRSPMGDDFVCDISLWFKLIMNILGAHVEPIKKGLRELKNLRNAVCHDELQMDESSLQNRLKKLGEMCREILQGAQCLINNQSRASLNAMIDEIDNSIVDLMKSKIEVDICSYLDDLNKFRKKKTSKMICEGRKELMSIYSKMKILNPCPWLQDSCFSDFSVDNTFTSPTLQESGTEVSVNDILNLSVRKTRFVPRVVIVSGVMGSGKTSLYRYLLHEWCNLSSTVVGLSGVDLVIRMEMKWLTSGSLAQYLREQLLKDTSRLFSESDIIPVLQEINVLFIIDGMDEATQLGYDLLKEIITKFTSSTIIVTTRPEFTLKVMKMAEDHINLHILGFTPENQEKYVEKVFAFKYLEKRQFHKETKAFMTYKNSVCASLSTHLALPLNLALLVMLWCDDEHKVTSVTTTRLYSKLYELSQQKLVQRLQSGGVGHNTTISLKVHRFFIELSRIAWTMMLEETLCITDEYTVTLIEFCEKENMDPMQALSTFLNSETKETLTSIKSNFSFHHSSSIEFLAAYYVTMEAMRAGSLRPLLGKIRTPRFQEVIMHITGLLKLKNALTFSLVTEIKLALKQCFYGQEISDPQILFRLIQEAEEDPNLCKVITPTINSEDSWVINSWDPPELTEAKRALMKATQAAPYRVYIYTQYLKKLCECPQLVDVIKLLEKIPTTKVKVFVERQFHTLSEQEQVDDLLVPLLNNNSLLEVLGHIGPSFAYELQFTTNIQSLTVRITSMETLWNLSVSLKKHREWKAMLMPSKKWSLKYLEIFLDVSNHIDPASFPYFHYQKELRLRLAGLTDEQANWAGQVVYRMSRRFECVSLQNSNISPSGVTQFLKASDGVKINVFRVLSNQIYTDQMEKMKYRGRQQMKMQIGML